MVAILAGMHAELWNIILKVEKHRIGPNWHGHCRRSLMIVFAKFSNCSHDSHLGEGGEGSWNVFLTQR